DDLSAALDGYAVPGEYAVAVTDLQTGQSISLNGDRPQLAGCVMNLFVLMAATDAIEEGRLAESAVGGLIASTTWSSNATTAKEIVRILGEGDGVTGTQRVADYIELLGLDGEVILDHPPLYAEYTIGRDPNNWVTADAMNQALVLLWEGDILAEPWRSFLLDHLEAVKPGLNYLVASVPATVSHKNGFFRASNGYVDNDAGIVRFTAGDREYAYVVTLLSQRVDVKYADVPLGQELMRTIHSYFTSTYP
ncbi:MAG: serine hydrolase, partial [Dehalococcoidia bacterium]